MTVDELLTALVLLIGFFVVFWVGKMVYTLLHRQYDLNHELTQRDNPALALSLVGYYAGLVLSVGGALVGPGVSLVDSLIALAVYGLLAVVLLNISWWVCDLLILRKFKVNDELIRDMNQGTGVVVAGVFIASGFILFGAIQGESGGILTAVVYWLMGQALLVLASYVYDWITPYDLHKEIENDNVAAGVGFAGSLIGIGVLIGMSGSGSFEAWRESLLDYLSFALVGLVLLPVVRFLTDKVLLPGVSLTDEIANQEKPNLGAAYIEAFAYISGAFLIYWCV
ncbi:DUF350 domain-containing protein [Dethiosulfatarculus sandiegensis]|uniref:DUF350 domain-containing protein n=1 Tax=Dethiosulfatarculus sandiegensis TaxID=1429043 RepID=A0A0D2JEZ4_9BACT|nr:DUF350 domain-containing protein [Dethiosulfatarculus sandiegensis]KIX14256.1 hypothetical protein X474_09865 [Dethiosulfatarculus sandiegensis]